MRYSLTVEWLVAIACCAVSEASLSADTTPAKFSSGVVWFDDYREAYRQAEEKGNWLLIWLEDAAKTHESTMMNLWNDEEVMRRLERFLPVRLPTTAVVDDQGKPVALSRHAAFADMHGQPGLAIVDLKNSTNPHFRYVVSVYPFADKPISKRELTLLLELPPGSLTQRTMIFAVRTHPESPRSTSGEFLAYLATEAESHSAYQASLMSQGHHHWEQRFHRINGELPGSLIAKEVCAQSWPGQTLLVAARDCVHSWRQSPGHWSAVREDHPVFGYDMKRGRNGIWYATGIFADNRR